MQCQDDLPIPSETPLNLKMFNARLTRSLIPASSCGFRLKDFELPIQDESEVQLYNLSVGRTPKSRQCGVDFANRSTRTRPQAVNHRESPNGQDPTQSGLL